MIQSTKARSNSGSHLVKLGDTGVLTLALPGMMGRYVVVEQRDGCVVISPFDLESAPPPAMIARCSGHATLIGTPAAADVPQA